MIVIQNYIEQGQLLLTWQSPEPSRKRYCVGTVTLEDNGNCTLTYNIESPAFAEAKENGFTGYPAFNLADNHKFNDVLDTFSRRLPPKSRTDFKKFLSNNCLPENFCGSNFSLIAHSGIRLPGDTFDLIPDFSSLTRPFDYLHEIAGTRYSIRDHLITFEQLRQIPTNHKLDLVMEPENEKDSNAIAFYYNDKKIGYVNRVLSEEVAKYISNDKITAILARQNGTEDRPLIYAMLRVLA